MRVAPAAPTAIDTKPPTVLPMIRLDAALSSAEATIETITSKSPLPSSSS
eukprot:CAMPEP_0203687856 /NCGR_PEP_ID=MMETSP0091-20130426/771_1 /ASSEMBLY_ACC=CAM_ASM_001089 /TAXON_ID=426623 /ORGANISM="Chaetoceros affinis, Strain CCMP159" /LENGTH=49 /DNA_ID= /DNA_START= /DNA_END= /DNA_ORIENTATION=